MKFALRRVGLGIPATRRTRTIAISIPRLITRHPRMTRIATAGASRVGMNHQKYNKGREPPAMVVLFGSPAMVVLFGSHIRRELRVPRLLYHRWAELASGVDLRSLTTCDIIVLVNMAFPSVQTVKYEFLKF